MSEKKAGTVASLALPKQFPGTAGGSPNISCPHVPGSRQIRLRSPGGRRRTSRGGLRSFLRAGRAAHGSDRTRDFPSGQGLRRLPQPGLLAGVRAVGASRKGCVPCRMRPCARSSSSDCAGARSGLPLPNDPARGEIAVKRRDLDILLLDHAAACGADVRQGWKVEAVRRGNAGSTVSIGLASGDDRALENITARFLVAADGRNSVTARLAGQLPDRAGAGRDPRGRIGLQTHVPCPVGFGDRVQMRWFADGYGGLCPVGNGELNISLAAPARAI